MSRKLEPELVMSSIDLKEHIICLRPEADFIEFDAVAPARFSVEYLKPDDFSLARYLEKTRALIIPAVGPKISNEIFKNSNIEMVQVTGAGIDRLDSEYCRFNKIAVCNVQGVSAFAVAEYCIGSAITLSRHLHLGNGAIKEGKYDSIRLKMLEKKMVSLKGQNVGIIGFGSIGRETARLFKMMGCEILCFDLFPPDQKETEKVGATICDLSSLLSQSDIVSLHVPLTTETKGLISKSELKLMKKNAILINAARGGVVKEFDLASAIESEQIKGAVVDVYSQEPASPDNPLLNLSKDSMDRVLYSPHIAGITKQSWTELFRQSWSNLSSFFDNKPLNNRQI